MTRRPLLALTVVTFSLGFSLALGEAAVRVLEHRRELGAARRARYEEAYQAKAFRKGGLGPGGYLAEGFRGYVSDELGRPVLWINNRAGFRREGETEPRPRWGQLRILYLGDSFVAGHRVGQDESFGALLEEQLRQKWYPHPEILLSAIEEPVRALDYLETRGLAWHPDVVLLGITLGNDLAQVHFNLGPHGAFTLRPDDGADRPNGGPALAPNPSADEAAELALIRAPLIPDDARVPPSETPRPLPSYLLPPAAQAPRGPLHLVGFLAALLRDRRERTAPQAILDTWGEYDRVHLFSGNGLGFCLKPAPAEIERSYAELEALLAAFARLCRREKIDCAVTPFPQRFQVQPDDWRETVAVYGLRPERFDLYAPNVRIAAIAARVGLTDLDSLRRLRARHARDGVPLYMPRGDMHWNRAGHRAYAEETGPALIEFLRPRQIPEGAKIQGYIEDP